MLGEEPIAEGTNISKERLTWIFHCLSLLQLLAVIFLIGMLVVTDVCFFCTKFRAKNYMQTVSSENTKIQCCSTRLYPLCKVIGKYEQKCRRIFIFSYPRQLKRDMHCRTAFTIIGTLYAATPESR